MAATVLILQCGLQAKPVSPQERGTDVIDTAHYYMEHSFDVLKYTLDFDFYANYFTPYPKSFRGNVNIRFRADSTLNSIFLNAVAGSLVIDSVRLNAVSFSTSGDTLFVQLDRTYNPGEEAEIRICYHHLNVTDHAFYVSGGTVFTDFPPEGARKVFPCWDRPSDKALTEVYAKVPLSVRLGSNGLLADSVVSGDTIRYHWVNSDPVSTYLITISSRNTFMVNQFYYHLYENPADSIPVRLYYKPNEVLTLVQQLIAPLTDFFSSRFGDYPFEKIGFATLNPAFPWGGMENQSMVNLMPGGYSNEDLIAHEHSHQWFGDLITCGTWADIWLNEGFGTFCESLWREQVSGYDVYFAKIKAMANVYLAQNPGIPIYNPMWAIHTPTSGILYSTPLIYNKGACVLHQLRVLLGDSVFFNVMRSYALDTNFRYENAVTEDFVNKVNTVTGQDYTWYFDQWVYHANHPEYENRYEIIDEGNDTWRLKFRINQVQQNTCFFRMPVDIDVEFEDTGDTTITVQNDENNQVFEFYFTRRPVMVHFDRNEKIVLKEANTVVGTGEIMQETGCHLYQNHPNPFGQTTEIEYSIDIPRHVKITILNSEGKLISTLVDADQEPGHHKIIADPAAFSPGVYFYKMESGTFSSIRKMIFRNGN